MYARARVCVYMCEENNAIVSRNHCRKKQVISMS